MSEPTRVLLVNAHGADTSVGGTEKHVARLGRELPAWGFAVSFLAAFPEAVHPPGPTVVLHTTHPATSGRRRRLNQVVDVLALPSDRLMAAVRAAAPDLVCTFNLPGLGTGVWEACRRLGVPVVHALNDYYLLCPRVTLLRPDGDLCRPHPALCGLRTRRLARWAPAVAQVVGVSEYLIERHHGLFPDERMHLIRNPADTAAGKPASPPGASLRTLGYLGNLDRIKGVDLLLDALPDLASLGCRLRVAGRGRLEGAVAAAAASPALDFVGSVSGEGKEAFLDSCDLGLVPSVWPEPGGPPFTLLEWLGRGRPVLASRRGGLAEALRDLRGPIPIEPTASAIVSEVARLRDGTAWRDAVARVDPVEAGGGEDAWVSAHVAVYRSALRERGVPVAS